MAKMNASRNPTFSTEMEAMERTTPGHCSEWNKRHQQLLDNDQYLKNQKDDEENKEEDEENKEDDEVSKTIKAKLQSRCYWTQQARKSWRNSTHRICF